MKAKEMIAWLSTLDPELTIECLTDVAPGVYGYEFNWLPVSSTITQPQRGKLLLKGSLSNSIFKGSQVQVRFRNQLAQGTVTEIDLKSKSIYVVIPECDIPLTYNINQVELINESKK